MKEIVEIVSQVWLLLILLFPLHMFIKRKKNSEKDLDSETSVKEEESKINEWE